MKKCCLRQNCCLLRKNRQCKCASCEAGELSTEAKCQALPKPLRAQVELFKQWGENRVQQTQSSAHALTYDPMNIYTFFVHYLHYEYGEMTQHKRRTWSIPRFLLRLGGSAVAAIAAAIVGSALTTWITSLLEKPAEATSGLSTVYEWIYNTVTSIGSSSGIAVLYFFILFSFFLFAFYQWDKKKDSQETWVRHSATYYRMELSLYRFTTSLMTDQDFNEFANSIFQIQSQTLDQFEYNLSNKGLVSHASNGGASNSV